MIKGRIYLSFLLLLFLLLPGACLLSAAEGAGDAAGEGAGEAPEKTLQEQTLPMRTALHHDPSLGPPFQRLLKMYREAGRLKELVQVYTAHTRAYPDDTNGLAVLIRLLSATGAPEAESLSADAVKRFPDNALLHFLRYQHLHARHNPRAIDSLDRAIALALLPNRQAAWLDMLLENAEIQGRRDLAEKHLKALAEKAGKHPASALDAARRMMDCKFHHEAASLLDRAARIATDAELSVEIEMEAARALHGAGNSGKAAEKLDALLARVTADYWRRPEILRRRLALVTKPESRLAMLEAARKEVDGNPRNEAAWVDLARILIGFSRRREALETLLNGGKEMPGSRRIEVETFQLFDRLCDERGREEYLAQRIKLFPRRLDLMEMHVKSLFVLGRSRQAESALKRLLEKIPPAEHPARHLALARYLRNSGLHAEAAGHFRKVIDADPARLGVMRELCEILCVLNRKEETRKVLSKPFPEDAGLEAYLDILQFMIEEKFYVEARRALVRRIKGAATSLDLRMKLIEVDGRLGDRKAGGKRILESRMLADTGPRYMLWLSTAVSFHENFDAVDAFLKEELARLEKEAEAGRKGTVKRQLALAKVLNDHDRRQDMVVLLQNSLARGLSAKDRVSVRRKLIDALSDDPGRKGAAEEQIKLLLEEAPGETHAWNLKLAIIYADSNRLDLAGRLLEGMAFDRISDPALLHDAAALCRKQFSGAHLEAILHRLTVVEPTKRGNWEDWIGELVLKGREYVLRTGVRRLLAGIDKMPLSESVQATLQVHLIDSFWRSISRLIADEKDVAHPSFQEALVLIDGLEMAAQEKWQRTLSAWARAYVLGRLGRATERDEAIAELSRLADKKIAFPDGLTITVDQAKKILTAGPQDNGQALVSGSRKGPLPRFKLDWKFSTRPGSYITRMRHLPGNRVFLCDSEGAIYCIDGLTGKIFWYRENVLVHVPPMMGQPIQQRVMMPTGGYTYVHKYPALRMTPVPVADGKGRVYLPEGGRIVCRSIKDGRALWKSAPVSADGGWTLFLHKDRLIGCNVAGGYYLSIDRQSGKLLIEHKFPWCRGGEARIQCSGASLSGDRLFVYGEGAASVLDAGTGETIYDFEPLRVNTFPLTLEEPDQGQGQGGGFSSSPFSVPVSSYPIHIQHSYRSGSIISRSSFSRQIQLPISSGYPGGYARASAVLPKFLNYHQRPLPANASVMASRSSHQPHPGGENQQAFVPPAVKWAAGTLQSNPRDFGGFQNASLGILHERFLLLMTQEPQEAIAVSCDLPLAGRIMQGPFGVFLGMTGKTACFLNNGVLVFLDITDGRRRDYILKDISGDAENPFLQAVLDGPLVYAAGPGGIDCINGLTQNRVFLSPWPESVGYDPFFSTSQGRIYSLLGVFTNLNNTLTSCMPLSCCVARDAFLVLTGPSTVTALTTIDMIEDSHGQ